MKTSYFGDDYSYDDQRSLSDFRSFLNCYSIDFKKKFAPWADNSLPPELKDTEILCKDQWNKFLDKFSDDATDIKSWYDVVMFLDKKNLFAYYDGYSYHGPMLDERANKLIFGIADTFFFLLYSNLLGLKTQIQRAQKFPFEMLLIFNNNLVIEMADAHINSLGSIEKFVFVGEFKKQLSSNALIRTNLEYDYIGRRILKTTRKINPLLDWLVNTVHRLTPPIAVKNREQFESLRIFFINQIDKGFLAIVDLDPWLQSQFYIINNMKQKRFDKSTASIYKGEHGKASEIIKDVFQRLHKLNSGNTIRDIQKWIYCSFFCEESDGFSLHHIKKITES